MKVINSNNIQIGSSEPLLSLKTTAREAVKQLIKINDDHIQSVKAEFDNGLLGCEMHPFVQAAHMAYAQHLPFVISPDMIWYLIASATALHINNNAEALRHKFVDHEGKETIKIQRNDFVLNSQTNPWHEVIDDFSSEIAKLTKNEVADIFMANFSTTTKDSRVISQIVLMDAMQKYFEFLFSTMCGIPEIRIMGSKEDWQNVQEKTKKVVGLIPEFQKWYSNGLQEVLDNFVAAFDNKVDNKFWNEIYKIESGSGGPFVTGWILALFPYLSEGQKNTYVWEGTWRDSCNNGPFSGVTTSSFSYHMNQVPFKWQYFNQDIDMLFVGGLIGVSLQKDNSLKPVFGYAVTEAKVQSNPQMK